MLWKWSVISGMSFFVLGHILPTTKNKCYCPILFVVGAPSKYMFIFLNLGLTCLSDA